MFISILTTVPLRELRIFFGSLGENSNDHEYPEEVLHYICNSRQFG
jgi:hypothetical protein